MAECKSTTKHLNSSTNKYNSMNKTPRDCCVCRADLRYLTHIYGINFKWYCKKCYTKYKMGGQK